MNSISGQLYRPIAQWTGQLILPSETQRHSDGRVYLTLENTPETYRHLKGQTVWLNWHSNSIHQTWINRAVTDIHFDEITRQSMENFSIHPTRLEGWSNVSALESLA
ncbi:MAG: type II CAAX prenyl endopeptidase Rce1 family protein, partial [Chroococcales cyanobacterium]